MQQKLNSENTMKNNNAFWKTNNNFWELKTFYTQKSKFYWQLNMFQSKFYQLMTYLKAKTNFQQYKFL